VGCRLRKDPPPRLATTPARLVPGPVGEFLGWSTQLVALARAIFGDPWVMILDEATSNVDVATEGLIQQGIERLMEGPSIVLAHRLSTIKRADRIVVIDHGRIAEMGSPAELRAAGGHYARLESQYESQQPEA
jgi:ABC-type multidrug transport system fused ATPase/permease subunit